MRTEDVEIVKNPDLSDPRFSAVPRRPAHGTALQAVEAAAIPRPETTSDQIQLAHEELIVGKAEVDHGGVYLRKVIRTETASRPIDLQREEFVIERTPLGDKPVAAAEFQPYEVRVNLAREEAVVGTRNYPTEFVRIRKQLHTDTEIVSANVRKENVELVKLTGASEYQGTPGSTVEIETSSGKDMQITERVETKLSNGSLGRKYSTVNVSSRSGIVTLTGTVDSESEKTEIGDAIAKVSGVSKVNNELKIRR